MFERFEKANPGKIVQIVHHGSQRWHATDAPVAKELELAGIPRDHIVLGFREPELRPYTEYAVK